MSEFRVYELIDSMSGSVTNESEQGEVRELTRRYVIGQCTNGFNEVVTQITDFAPEYINSDFSGIFWVRKRLNVNGIGNAYFDCTATYQTMQPKGGGGDSPQGEYESEFVPGSISWDTTGHTEHITQGISGTEVRVPAESQTFYGAINVSGDSVQGLDVVRPNLRYSETWILPAALAVNCNFIGAVYRLTGTVNAQQFRCFEPGTALFMGARAQWNGDQPYVSCTFDWECRPNDPNLYPFDGAAGFLNKRGWEHVWIRYESEAENDTLIRKPIAAYKNKVYREESWVDLGIVAAPIGNRPRPRGGQAAAQGGNGLN